MDGGGAGNCGGPRGRRDGFTAAKKGACVAALAKYGNVADACRVAGISTTSFYRHFNRWPDFRGACEAALAKAAGNIEILAWERGVTGIEEPVIHHGKVVGTRRKRSDAIFKLILQASNRKKYGRVGQSGETKKQIEKRLRKEIEAEMRARAKREPNMEAVRDEVLRRLAALRAHKDAKGEG